MNFGEAIDCAKEGKKICRDGWNGKGMFVFLGFPRVEVNHFDGDCMKSTDASELFACNYSGPVMCMKTAQNTIVVGWLASQTDMIAEDWSVLE